LADLIVGTADWPIIEIGPGLGALTRPLLERGAAVTAVEVDRGLAAALRLWPECGRTLTVVESDLLRLDLGHLAGPGPYLVCGNIPYNLTSPIVLWCLAQGPAAPKAVLTMQAEVARRLAAAPGGRDYGRLTVAAALGHQVEILMDIPASAFRPRPKVLSSVVRLTRTPGEPKVPAAALARLTAAAFHARRKTLANNLSAVYGRERALAALEAVGLDPGGRAETVPPAALAALAAELEGA
jgi:16S rRNA (adenine1518-N6/adenine1519-N6)-dimethyltransferase